MNTPDNAGRPADHDRTMDVMECLTGEPNPCMESGECPVISTTGFEMLFVDDLRNPPSAAWVVTKTATEAIELLKTGRFAELSLDHDLGDDDAGTGYDIATWLEEQAAYDNWQVVPDVIGVHSANPPGRRRIRAAINSIDRMRGRKMETRKAFRP